MKKIVFTLVALVAIGLTSNAQALRGFTTLKFGGFGLVSSYAGPCVSAPGFCSGGIGTTDPTNPDFPYIGIMESTDHKVTLGFNAAFRSENMQYLKDNVIVVGKAFSLPKEVTNALGMGEYVIKPGTYNVTYSQGYFYCTF